MTAAWRRSACVLAAASVLGACAAPRAACDADCEEPALCRLPGEACDAASSCCDGFACRAGLCEKAADAGPGASLDGGAAGDGGASCAPSCAGRACGSDGCGGQCGDCGDAGVCDELAGLCAVDCFGAPDGGPKVNANLMPLAALAGPMAQGGVACGLDGLTGAFNDGRFAGLAFSGTLPTTVDGQAVTACALVDFGRACLVDDDVGALGLGYQFRVAGAACGDPGAGACHTFGTCAGLDGTSLATFAALDPSDFRHVVDQTSCGSGLFGGYDFRFRSFSRSSSLRAVRFLLACRPAVSCDASMSNVELDSLVLTYRTR